MITCLICQLRKDSNEFEVSSVNGIFVHHKRICKACQQERTKSFPIGVTEGFSCTACKKFLPVTSFAKSKRRENSTSEDKRLEYSWKCNDCREKQKAATKEKKKLAVANGVAIKRRKSKAQLRKEKEQRLDNLNREARALGMDYGEYKAMLRRQEMKEHEAKAVGV